MSSTVDHRYDWTDGPRNRLLRVGDKERDAVTEILRRRHLEGRLDADEFQVRLERCLAAKTYADLDELVADFPRDKADRRQDRATWTWRPWPRPFVFLPIALIVAVAAGAHVGWLIVPLFFFVVRPLLYGGWGRGYRGF